MVDSSEEQLNTHRQECLCHWSFSAECEEGMMAKKLKPVHPGEIVREEFMAPLELSMNKMAMALRVPVTRIADIVNEHRGITADTALRFARYFKNSPAFWMNLQTRYDLEVAEDEIAAKVARDVQPLESVGAREG
jgi:addiction module HigA family antidote